MLARTTCALLAALAPLAAGCGGGEKVKGPPPAAPERISLTSTAFQNGADIPNAFSCDGDDSSPPLKWSGVPADAKELALVMEDPDAPGGTFVHWTVYKIPPSAAEAPAGAPPQGAAEGESSFGRKGYGGPCPPKGDEPHRYRFLLYALPTPSGLQAKAKPDQVRKAIADAGPLARGTLEGRFGR